MEQISRWQQRLKDFKEAGARLQEALARKKFEDLEKDGVIQRFEFTFELAWKTLKDYLEDQGVTDAASPKKVLQKAFQENILLDGQLWMEMLEDRNKLSHIYRREMSEDVFVNIKEKYAQALGDLVLVLEKELWKNTD